MSDNPIRPEEGAHWYGQDAVPRWDATLKDAREEDLLPGQSSVTGQLAKPGLENWKLNQLLLASLTLPQLKGEPLEAYAERVAADFTRESESARDLGHFLHDRLKDCVIARRENGPDAPLPPLTREPADQMFRPAYDWIDQNIIGGFAEDPIVSLEYGHGGTLDFHGFLDDDPTLLTIIDWKSQNVKGRYKRGPRDPDIEFSGEIMPLFKFYPEHRLQLGAYRQALLETLQHETAVVDVGTLADPDAVRYSGPWRPHMAIRCASGMISTNPQHPGFAVKFWKAEEILGAYVDGFLPLLSVWRWLKAFPYHRREN